MMGEMERGDGLEYMLYAMLSIDRQHSHRESVGDRVLEVLKDERCGCA